MDALIERLLSAVKLGTPERRGSITLLPILGELPAGPEYLTLVQAIADNTLKVEEVDEGGSVPNLIAKNVGKASVLILDGEELMGAKQNRVLNTTVLIAPGTEILIPVSCVEQGRWHYTSRQFRDSGHHSPHHVRAETQRGVTVNAMDSQRLVANQSEVWDAVAFLSAREAVSSPTGAMWDVYEDRGEDVAAFVSALEAAEGQTGVVAARDGKVIGFDIVSRPEAYALLHDKLVSSYVFDARGESSSSIEADERAAKDFLVRLGDVTATTLESPGVGTAYRYSARDIVGSALVVDGDIVHAAFFGVDEEPGAGSGDVAHASRMTGSGRRAEYRREGDGEGQQ